MKHAKSIMVGRRSFDRENLTGGILSGRKRNQCVILPANIPMVADSFERRNQNWIARANSPPDLIIQVGDSSFHLHKLPMVSRSEYLNRLVFDRSSNRESADNILKIQVENLPGGAKTFELVVKFCYGWKIEIKASNVASLNCAAHFLEMSDDLEKGNLISKSDAFLSFLMLSSWKDTFRILKCSEPISSWAKELDIVKRCTEAIAWKACINPKAFNESSADTWWFEDVSSLRIDHFIEVIQSIKRRGMKSDLVGSCIAQWTTKWLSQVTLGLEKMTPKHITHQLHRVTVECLIKILPAEENSVPCSFLLHLLKAGVMLKINPELLNMLEKRIAFMLEQCRVEDLLVKNQAGDNDSTYDVAVVHRVLQFYVSYMFTDSAAKFHVVGSLVDGYLTQIARDENVTVESFQSIVEVLPQNARYCDDSLYRAIDVYLKAHPDLTEEERTRLCKVLEYHSLSQEARQHVMKNERLPLKLTTRFVLLEQVSMTRSMTKKNYRRTGTQTIIRVSKDFENGWLNAAGQEIQTMRKDMEMMKSQLKDLLTCKIKLQKQLKRFVG
ncbi:root phototropism protein 3-like [Prosopis cineraria]|uniref:root phototropism protein 3-like n=1 Tax=Prosopis cineraria TaxID=364024 RepID=UPI00240F7BA7|nr:root phototropism protein 3-like [Prosopis cineraria]